jgi:stringent starvation protein B
MPMPDLSTKPYLIRAIHEWCTDSGFTPYVAVAVDESVQVPTEFVKNGEIVLNVSTLATNRLKLGNEFIEFQARFGGVAREVMVPVTRVVAIYARENGQGMAFDLPRSFAAPAGSDGAADVSDTPPVETTNVAPRERGALVPVAPAPTQAGEPSPTDHPPQGPKPGDRPKLTRIK